MLVMGTLRLIIGTLRPSFRLNLNNFLATSPILDLDVSLDGIRLGPKHCPKKNKNSISKESKSLSH